MLDKIDLKKKLSKEEYKAMEDEFSRRIALAQRRCKELNIPVIILFEGWGASGKGTLIGKLIRPLDPRGFTVFTVQDPTEEEALRPFMWRFWKQTPAFGRIHIFDQSWYERALLENKDNALQEIMAFEEQLSNAGYLIIKLFLHISQKEQAQRFEALKADSSTAWRVTDQDWKQNKHYNEWVDAYDKLLIGTDKSYAPWTVIESMDKRYASMKILVSVTEAMEKAADARQAVNMKAENAIIAKEDFARTTITTESIDFAEETKYFENHVHTTFQTGVLAGVDLSLALTRDDYKAQLCKLQDKLARLHNEMYKYRLPVVLGFEGWDAGGKGGAIKRITECIDPRGYEVCPTSAPNDIEKAHQYLWRFWEKVPKSGHMTIFDRTWYGRVMVERIERFCSEEDWKRAYHEINQMERSWTDAGCVVLKFWLQIDKDEQERRFNERMNTPEKQWKITDEDWRNRAKWDDYEEAIDEMIVKTSTTNAPWILISGNNKYYARIQVLTAVCDAIEKKLEKIRD